MEIKATKSAIKEIKQHIENHKTDEEFTVVVRDDDGYLHPIKIWLEYSRRGGGGMFNVYVSGADGNRAMYPYLAGVIPKTATDREVAALLVLIWGTFR